MFGQEVNCYNGRLLINGDRVIDSNLLCPNCGKGREHIGDGEGFCINFSGTNDQRLRMERQ
jgi:hypothetical protein